ncbi:hypothetical protein [Shewanella woodyi]|nr:hypothetical protein [Shewanella woodyi]
MPFNVKSAPGAGMLAIQFASIWTGIFDYLLFGPSDESSKDKAGVK